MEHEKEFHDGQRVLRWVSIETVISVLVMLVGLGTVYGSLSTRLASLSDDVAELKGRDITPGARMEIASIHATDRAIQQQVDDLRDEMRAERKEIREALQRVEQKLDEHDRVRK